MTRALDPTPEFMVTAEGPCPYLPGRLERKVTLALDVLGPRSAQHLLDYLQQAGFRRNYFLAYRPICAGCGACLSVRLRLADFSPSRSMRRVLARNAGLALSIEPPRADRETFRLFSRYLAARHGESEMAEMNARDFAALIESSPVDTRLAKWRNSTGQLIAACLADWSRDGISAVYSFFDPEAAQRSLGSFVVLQLAETAASQRLPYLYLGYWVSGSRKMDYKARFRPLEAFGPQGWQALP